MPKQTITVGLFVIKHCNTFKWYFCRPNSTCKLITSLAYKVGSNHWVWTLNSLFHRDIPGPILIWRHCDILFGTFLLVLHFWYTGLLIITKIPCICFEEFTINKYMHFIKKSANCMFNSLVINHKSTTMLFLFHTCIFQSACYVRIWITWPLFHQKNNLK